MQELQAVAFGLSLLSTIRHLRTYSDGPDFHSSANTTLHLEQHPGGT